MSTRPDPDQNQSAVLDNTATRRWDMPGSTYRAARNQTLAQLRYTDTTLTSDQRAAFLDMPRKRISEFRDMLKRYFSHV